ncbi:hypothetical protein [Alicyclobacillus macrosporangiidus]|uniref:hypothetical protein n=1 Tax=Alicyclobacillus macrosporangiidus TaxID=392015 RepID=UPI0012DC0248|nr:hypothetical protein [Alicyclobacillus macrosporangiidus]
MKRKHLGLLAGMALLAVPSMVQGATIQSNVVTVTAGHYVQTGTQQVPETVTVPKQQCQNVQVQTGSGMCTEIYNPFYGWTSTCPAGASLTNIGFFYCFSDGSSSGSGIYASYTNFNPGTCGPPGTMALAYDWVTYQVEQQCQTVYVQQTQYVTQPVYSWVPTSVSQ